MLRVLNKSVFFNALIVLLVSTAAISQAALEKYSSPAEGFSVGYPPSWTKSPEMKPIAVGFSAPVSDGSGANFNVVVTPDGGLDGTGQLEAAKPMMAKVLQAFSEKAAGKWRVGDKAGAYMEYVHNLKGKDYRAMTYIVTSGGKAYTLTCTALDDRFESYRAIFGTIAQSFRLTK